VDQIQKTIAAIEKQFHVSISEEKLARAIREQNRIRGLLGELEALRQQVHLKVTGAEAYAAIIAGTGMPPTTESESS
jgi:benzoyl-CoA reductase/2-hydroxyglutaryl-CoA dehydratase subunit BcrC/BadD/HgdB